MRRLEGVLLMRARTVVALVACAALPLVGGCSSETPRSSGLSIVASTDVWGDVAKQVAGDLADVTSIIDDPSADPHSFEASARVELELSRADLVVVNGGGYDDFATQLLDALDAPPPVVDAVEVSDLARDEHADDEHADDEHGHSHGDTNEHVWYDIDTVRDVAHEIAQELAEIDPEHAEQFASNAQAFDARLETLGESAARIAAEHGGEGAVVTEPVPAYLVAEAGLQDRTPPAFSSAIEQELDVPPAAMDDTLELVTSHDVAVVVHNEQTTGPQTDRVVQAARDAGVPVVNVTETLPEGEDYVSWMAGNLDALERALA